MHPFRPALLAAVAILLAAPAAGVGASASAAGTPQVRAGSHSTPVASTADTRPRRHPRRYREYVSLGDSWSADVVLVDTDGVPDTTHAPIDCAQSHRNYPKRVARALGIPLHRDATCGSATTDDFTKPQSLPAGGSNPPQFDRLTRRTDLVTVGIGGNDAGIAAAALDCLSVLPMSPPVPPGTVPTPPAVPVPLLPGQPPLGGCKERFTEGGEDQLAQQIRASKPKLVKAIKQIRRRAPEARILMVDYLAAVPKQGCYPLVPVTDSDMAYLYGTFRKLNAMVRSAARQGGAEFVNTYRPTRGHDVCQPPHIRYAEMFGASVNSPAVGVPAHPNSAGAAAQAAAVLKRIRRR